MDLLVEFLAQNGLMLLSGSSLLLAVASVGTYFQRSPIQCRRFGELALVCVLAWLVLACFPIPRWAVAQLTTASPLASESRVLSLPDSFESAQPDEGLLPHVVVPHRSDSRPEPGNADTSGPLAIEPTPQGTVVVADEPNLTAPSDVPARLEAAAVPGLSSLVAGLYLVGCGACAGWLLLGHVILLGVRHSATAAEPWLQELYEGLPWKANRRRPLLIVTRRGGRPMSWGAWRPIIALPLELSQPASASRLRQVLLHELAHVAQRDAWGNLLFVFAFPLLYFHPLYWWLRSQVRFAGELIADDWAVHRSTREVYVQALIALAQSFPRGRGHLGVLSASQSPTQFYRRMNMLLQRQRPLATRCSRWWRLIYVPLLVIAAGLAIGLLGVQPAVGQAGADDLDEGRRLGSGDKISLDTLKGVDERSIERISAAEAGRIEKLYKATGQRVKKGESLAEFHSPALFVATQELLEASRRGADDLLRVCREKLRLLGMSDDQIDEVLKAGKPVSRLTIRAPLDGYVKATYALKGTVVKAGDPLFDLVDLSAVAVIEGAAAKPVEKDDKVPSLLKERLATLKELSAATKTAYAAGKATFAEVAQVNAQMLAAELELCKSGEERVAVHEQAVALAKAYEKTTVELYKAAQVTHSSVLAATVNRLAAEIACERAKTRAGKQRD